MQTEEELINCYAGTIKSVRLALPVNYKKIVQFVCDLAQMEFGTASDATHIKNYYVVTLLMAGVIDDLEESLNEILRAADLPISVIIIKIGAAADTDNDSALLFEKSAPVFKKCERVFIELLDYERYKNKKDPESDQAKFLQRQFGFDLIRNLPKQIEKFFELQHFDLDVSNHMIESPEHTLLSSSEGSAPYLGSD